MKKIPSLFVRDFAVKPPVLSDAITPGCEWVVNGEGVATRKWDGAATLFRDGILHKRYDAKQGKTPPPNWVACQPAPDPVTTHWPGWMPVGDGPEDKDMKEAYDIMFAGKLIEGMTYEYCGPKVNGNPEHLTVRAFIQHGIHVIENLTMTFAGIKEYLEVNAVEGIVWHHKDGRMAKIKRRDFGLAWPVEVPE